MRLLPTFAEEKLLWEKGYDYVIGMDEVGRGAFAGPVVVAGAVFPKNIAEIIVRESSEVQTLFAKINDSKKVSPMLRKQLNPLVLQFAEVRIVKISHTVIDKIGVGKATTMAFRRVVGEIKIKYQTDKTAVLVDGFHIARLKGIGRKRQKAIVKGDQISLSIAAASIVAKVYRDTLMEKLDKKFPLYGFAQHKGYGTSAHRLLIAQHGLSSIHRKSFCHEVRL